MAKYRQSLVQNLSCKLPFFFDRKAAAMFMYKYSVATAEENRMTKVIIPWNYLWWIKVFVGPWTIFVALSNVAFGANVPTTAVISVPD